MDSQGGGTPRALVVGVMVAVIVVIGAVVLAFVPLGGSGSTGGSGSAGGFTAPVDTVAPEPTDPVPTFTPDPTIDPTTDPPYTDPDPSPTAPTYQVVDAPGGMSVSIPSSWSVRQGAVSTNMQADDPDGDCFLRFGGGPADRRPLGTVVSGFEHTTPSIQTGYQRLQLTSVTFGRSAEAAVDWEFTFSSGTGPRHAYGRYWRIGGTDYVVYASCAADDWSQAEQPLSTMFDTASPQ